MSNKIVIGDNPLFGVSHSHSGGVALSEQEITEFLVSARSDGFELYMFTPHTIFPTVVDSYSRRALQGQTIRACIVVPYPHAVNDMLASGNWLGLFKDLFHPRMIGSGIGSIMKAATIGVVGNLDSLMKVYIQSLVRRYTSESFKVEYVALHNIFTDLLLALGRHDLLKDFRFSCEALGIKPVFLTQNLGTLVGKDFVNGAVVCGSFNPEGYMVHPSLSEVKIKLADRNCEVWAMQLFSSGVGNYKEVEKFVTENSSNLDKLVIASRSSKRLKTTAQLADILR